MIKLISWNLLRLTGASLDDVVRLIQRENPDLLLMQEVTQEMDGLTSRVGGGYLRSPMPGRIHGLAIWTPAPFTDRPVVRPLPSGAVFNRVCQIIKFGPIAVANVHLSHGQVLNRRQLRSIAKVLPYRAAVVGDFNLIGPAMLPGFRDVGPRETTHFAGQMVPLRIDRCLVRDVSCLKAITLLREASDHRPIVITLDLPAHRLAAEVSLHRPSADVPMHRPSADVPMHHASADVPMHRPLADVPMHHASEISIPAAALTRPADLASAASASTVRPGSPGIRRGYLFTPSDVARRRPE